MYIDTVPNRNSPPAILLRESSRVGKKIVKRTLANLSDWPATQIDSLRRLLKGESLISFSDAVEIQRSLPHGHVAAALGTLRRIGLESDLARAAGPERDLVCALIWRVSSLRLPNSPSRAASTSKRLPVPSVRGWGLIRWMKIICMPPWTDW
jgi:hypothetical protein